MSEWEPSGAEPRLKGVSSVREPTRAERTIARRTAETRATVPDLELGVEVDAGPGLSRAAAHDCSFTAVLVQACAQALREHPKANSAYRDGRYELYSRVNIGVTVPTEDAYLAPTLLDADTRDLADLHAQLELVAARAAAGQLRPPELAGSTFTLTDLGGQGVDRGSALITPPQAAALTAGAVREVAVIRGGEVGAGHTVSLTLAADSRILFGPAAGRFLAAVAARLQSDHR